MDTVAYPRGCAPFPIPSVLEAFDGEGHVHVHVHVTAVVPSLPLPNGCCGCTRSNKEVSTLDLDRTLLRACLGLELKSITAVSAMTSTVFPEFFQLQRQLLYSTPPQYLKALCPHPSAASLVPGLPSTLNLNTLPHLSPTAKPFHNHQICSAETKRLLPSPRNRMDMEIHWQKSPRANGSACGQYLRAALDSSRMAISTTSVTS